MLIESAHAILAGLDPSDEMAYALFHKKLWGVHLNDQNGLKYDQDKAFGSGDLRRAFNQVDVLVRNGYGKAGEIVGLDVKAMRTQPADKSHLHLKHSKEIFLMLVDLAHSIDRKAWQGYVDALSGHGWEIVDVPPADDCPDAVFIEDTVVMFDDLAVITRPGAPSRFR